MSKIRILKNCENTQIVLFLMTVFFLLVFFFLIFEGLAAPSFSKPAKKKKTNTHIVSAYWIFLTEIPRFNNVNVNCIYVNSPPNPMTMHV